MEIESIKSVGVANSGAASSYVPPVSDTSGNSVKVVNDTQKAVETASESNSDSNNQSEVQNQANENRKVAKSTIREVPPEETLEAIKKIWEIAGIIVDEKR